MDWSKLPSVRLKSLVRSLPIYLTDPIHLSRDEKPSTEMKGQMKAQSSEMKGRSSEEIVARLKVRSPPALTASIRVGDNLSDLIVLAPPASSISLECARTNSCGPPSQNGKPMVGRFVESLRDDWEKLRKPTDGASLLAAMRDYMEFAWDKAVNHRRLSCIRLIDHFCEWIWLLVLRRSNLERDCDDSDRDCGQPALALICKRYNFPIHPRCRWRIDDNGLCFNG